MSHKTIIAGTSYDITGGTNLVDGTIFHIGGGGRRSTEPSMRSASVSR